MGGGDLNMKKHFHPLTRENLERVWKAEKKRDEELKRIEERKKEITEERAREELLAHANRNGVIQKKEERLEWMYAGCRVNTEEFLLGKEISDDFLENAAAQKKAEFIARRTGTSSSVQTVDLARKIREDPLFLIKKREASATRSLLENSARIKQIIQQSKRGTARSTCSRAVANTPSTSHLTVAGWETPNVRQRSPSKSGHGRHSRKHMNGESVRSRSNHRRSRSNSSEDNARALQKMIENSEWRERTRKKKIRDEGKEEQLNKKLEEHINKFQLNRMSTFGMLDSVKMGTWSGKRYVAR